LSEAKTKAGGVMQQKQVMNFNDEGRNLLPRTQELINHLETLWEDPPQQSPETFKRIIKFLSQLPDPYQALGMTKIAEYFASSMGLHFIDLLAKFQETAELEGMDKEEIVATLDGAITKFFLEIMEMSKRIVTRSLDDLVTASNITFGLYTLSQSDTAEDTQSWIYELPTLYLRYLSQERLMTNMQIQYTLTHTVIVAKYNKVPSWGISLPDPVPISTTEQKGLTIE
jgi:hypothetical protein